MPACSPGPPGARRCAWIVPSISLHHTPSSGRTYWLSFWKLMTAKTMLARVDKARGTAENRIRKSFFICGQLLTRYLALVLESNGLLGIFCNCHGNLLTDLGSNQSHEF